MNPHRVFPSVAAALLVGVAGCGDSSGPEIGPPTTLVLVTPANQTAQVGQTLASPLVVRVRDGRSQDMAGIAVSFSVAAGGGTVSPAVVTTDAQGLAQAEWTLGTVAGAEQRVEVRVARDDGSALTAAFTATALAGPATLLERISGNDQVGGTGGQLADSLVVRVTDQYGNGIGGAAVAWSVQDGHLSAAGTLTSPSGHAAVAWTLGGTIGPSVVTATTGSLAPVVFNASATLGITAISPAIIKPGDTITVTGVNLSPSVAANVLNVAGLAVPILSASATEVRGIVPVSMPCLPGGNATVTLVSGGLATTRSHPIVSARSRAFAVGEVVMSSPDEELDCIELPLDGSRYLIAVTNTNDGFNSSASFRLRARSASGVAAAVTSPAAVRPRTARPGNRSLEAAIERRRTHDAILRGNLRLMEDLSGAAHAREPLRPEAAAQQVVPNVGDTLTIRVPRIDVVSCAAFNEIRARVAVVGQRGIVLEDVANPLANQMDSYYTLLSNEFDSTVYDAVRTHFGDPLRLDAQLDNNGRVLMVFTQRVPSNATGFVFSGDLFPRDICQQSNLAEVFYGFVPTVNDPGFAAGTIGEWYWAIRSTVVHELKHVASFAARKALDDLTTVEAQWLEESTAMIAEELWARDVFGYTQGGNTGYLQSVGCEVRGALPDVNWPLGPRPECQGRPAVTWAHFNWLADWLEAPTTRSPLGGGPGDGSFYGSGWLFVRWLLDHAAADEATVLTALIETSLSGAQNIEARFGRPFRELVSEWALAATLDDLAGFSPTDPRFTVPSWHLRDVYLGLHTELVGFPLPFPLSRSVFSFGNADFTIPTIYGGSTAYFELSGTPQAPQSLEFTSTSGDALNSALRVSIVRLQ